MRFRSSVLAPIELMGMMTFALLSGCGGGSSAFVTSRGGPTLTSTPTPAASTPTGPGRPSAPPVVLVPACINPVRLVGAFNPEAPGYIVTYVEGTDAAEHIKIYVAKYGLTNVTFYNGPTLGFAAMLSPEAVAELRCDPVVATIEYDAFGGGAGGGFGGGAGAGT